MSRKKGKRRERRVYKILEEVGFRVENPNYAQYQNQDFFNLFDLMALHKNRKPHYIQVKSTSASGINDFVSECSDFVNFEHVKVEYWVYHKREGWRIIDIKEDNYEIIYDGRKDNKKMDKGAIDYKNQG
jgi:Holliday junction resolvase